jgi:type IV secretion system protein VirB4
MIIGPSGSGKSTLLGLMVAQHMRYPGAQAFVFDRGYSMMPLAKAMEIDGAARHHVVDEHSKLGLCPLSRIDDGHGEQAWAASWIESMALMQGFAITPDDRYEILNGIKLLAGERMRTLTNLKPKIASAKIKGVLEAIILGPLGEMLNAERDGLDESPVHVFELEELMKMERKYSVPVLQYLIHVIDRRIGTRPTMIALDEAWTLLEDEYMAQIIRGWLKMLRKKNASLVAGTQDLEDLERAPMVGNVLLQECVTKIFLPNFSANKGSAKQLYMNAGLTAHETQLLHGLTRKRDYFYTSPDGRRVFGLDLGPVALSFIGASSGDELGRIKELARTDPKGWVARWLLDRGLGDWAEAWRDKIEPDAPIRALTRRSAA